MADLAVTGLGRTDTGKVRERNEDRALVGRRLFAVADGVGGQSAGDLASEMLVEHLRPLDERSFATPEEAEEALIEAIVFANAHILEQAQASPAQAGMATTVTAALHVAGTLVLAQVGDTRAYLKRGDGPLEQLTPEHSYVAALVEAGVITQEAAKTHPKRSVILRAVGTDTSLQVDLGRRVVLQPGDEVLLASDGVHGVVPDDELDRLVHDRTLPEAVDAVVQAALDAGGPDNITIVVVRASAEP